MAAGGGEEVEVGDQRVWCESETGASSGNGEEERNGTKKEQTPTRLYFFFF